MDLAVSAKLKSMISESAKNFPIVKRKLVLHPKARNGTEGPSDSKALKRNSAPSVYGDATKQGSPSTAPSKASISVDLRNEACNRRFRVTPKDGKIAKVILSGAYSDSQIASVMLDNFGVGAAYTELKDPEEIEGFDTQHGN